MTVQEALTILEIQGEPTAKSVREAYLEMVKVWHPDRFSHDPRLQEKAQEKLKEINLAYENLRDYRPGAFVGNREAQSASGDGQGLGSQPHGADGTPPPSTEPSRTAAPEPSGPGRRSIRRVSTGIAVTTLLLTVAYAVRRPVSNVPAIEPTNPSVALEPVTAASLTKLGNQYFDAKRYKEAIPIYAKAMRLSSRDVAVSNDLAVSYYYVGDSTRALEQVNYSLSIDPKNAKALLNKGIFQAFGLHDLSGASTSFRRVVDVSPNSPEAKEARRALASIRK